MGKRPSLASAVKASAQGTPTPSAATKRAAAQPKPAVAEKGVRSPSREGKKAAYAWLDPADHKRLRMMSLETSRSVDALVGEAVCKMLDGAGYRRS